MTIYLYSAIPRNVIIACLTTSADQLLKNRFENLPIYKQSKSSLTLSARSFIHSKMKYCALEVKDRVLS